MHQYELMVILDPSVEEKTVEPSIQKFLKVITAAKGTVDAMNMGKTPFGLRNPETDRRYLRGCQHDCSFRCSHRA